VSNPDQVFGHIDREDSPSTICRYDKSITLFHSTYIETCDKVRTRRLIDGLVTFKLISATPSPYTRKVRIALLEKGLPFELISEVPWDSTTSTPRYNPLEKLPILILEDGSSVYESSFILQYLEWKHPETPLLPGDVDGMLAARRLEVLCDGVYDAVVLTFFERMCADGARSPELLVRQRRKIDGGVGEMARLLGVRPFAGGQNSVSATSRLEPHSAISRYVSGI